VTVNARFQFRRDTAANWTTANPVLLAGELGLETDTHNLKIGDGATTWTSLAYLASGPTGAQGATGAAGASGTVLTSGSATLNFGYAQNGATDTATAVTGQGSILSTSNILLFVMGDTTVDHSPDEHLLAGLICIAESIVPGTGFTIRATAAFGVMGLFTVRWIWY
jgi:hypothetical protein